MQNLNTLRKQHENQKKIWYSDSVSTLTLKYATWNKWLISLKMKFKNDTKRIKTIIAKIGKVFIKDSDKITTWNIQKNKSQQ